MTHAGDAFFGLAVQRFAAKRLPRHASAHSKRKAGDFSTTTAAGCSIDEDEPQQLRWCRTRAVPAANSDSINLVPGAIRPSLLENRTGSNAAETRCGSEEARRYVLIVSSSRSWNGGGSTSSAAESPPARHGGLACMHRRETWMPDVGCGAASFVVGA